ncbi:MAG: M56 family metallopeptidase [Verrucomicrobiota bacterium]
MMTPDLPFWTRLLLRLAVEAAGLVGAAWLLDRLIRPAFWRRALWQGAVISLLLLTASELSGFGRGLASFLIGHARPEQKIAIWTSPARSAPPSLPSSLPSPLPSLPPFWLAGGLAVLGRVAAAQILFISLRRRRPVVTQTDLKGRVHAILQRLAFRRKIRLLQSPGLTGPIAFGILRPSVGLPMDFAAKFSRAEQDAMLAHELAHLASRDPLWYLLADVSSAALWWHPQAWWARCRLHRASELAADEAAAIFPEGPAALAECLVTLGRQMTRFPAASRMGVEGGFRSHLAERVQRLLRLADTARQPIYSWRAHAARMGAIISISAAAIGLSGCLQSRNAVNQPTLQANLSQSWNASPASTVWHSALPPQKPAPSSAPRPVKFQPAQPETASLGMGTFHVEPNSCIQALRHLFPKDGDVQAGAMLNRFFEGVGINLTNDGSFTLINPRTGDILARATMRNLDSMAQAIDLLNKIPPVDSVDQAKKLVNQSRTTGSIFLDKRPERAALETGQPMRVSDFPSPPSPLRPWLGLGQPMPMSDSERAMLEKGQRIRVIPLDTNTFLQGLQEVFPQILARPAGATEATGGLPYLIGTNGASGRNSLFTQCFASIGINLTNNAGWIVFDQRTGAVLVRATSQELDVVEYVIQLLNKVPPQVQFDIRFASLTKQDDNAEYFNWFWPTTTISPVRSLTINPISGEVVYMSLPDNATQNTNLPRIFGLFMDGPIPRRFEAIEQSDGSHNLASRTLTTESGRHAHLHLGAFLALDTNVSTDVPNASSNSSPLGAEAPGLDLLPTVSADGFSMHISVTATLTELNGGLEVPGQFIPQAPAGRPAPAPPLKQWRSSIFARRDGQPFMLVGRIPATATNQQKDEMIFITPRIIDPAGNPVHTDDELKAQNSIPPPWQETGVPK